jgi:hypothetical protein
LVASSTKACLIIISLFLYVLVDASIRLQAQLKLGSSLFFQFSKSWLVAASSVEAWLIIFFFIFLSLGRWLQAQLKHV